ncbi:ANGL4 protein, partial [Atractosteus spatula]|nr:ANGL4 protein [Atractosteus spatula]
MKTAAAALVLCTAILLESAAAFPTFERKGTAGKEKKAQFASWDDVNVIAHGLLQLGHGLKEHVDKTKGQIREIFAKLKSFNGTVAELGRQTQKLQEDSVVLGADAQSLKYTELTVLSLSAELREKARKMQRESQKVQDRMSQLEEKVNGLLRDQGPGSSNANFSTSGSDVRIIQSVVEAQNQRIDDLVERIRQQQDKLDKQNIRIRNLQNQIDQGRAASPGLRSFLKRKVVEVARDASAEQADSPADMASDCHVLFLRGERKSGVYTVQPINSQPFQVYCEMTAEGGQTVVQRRQDGSVDFDQPWQAYKNGFGSLDGEFWLGLEKIHALSKQGSYVLHVQLTDWDDKAQSIQLPFQLDGEGTNYSLHLQERPLGSVESALSSEPSGLPFSTQDRDNDSKLDMNCAKHLTGGWWFSNCGRSNLNGRYFHNIPRQRHERKQGMFWKTWRGRYYPLKSTLMKIAPVETEYDL